jgi:hypothetical protein
MCTVFTWLSTCFLTCPTVGSWCSCVTLEEYWADISRNTSCSCCRQLDRCPKTVGRFVRATPVEQPEYVSIIYQCTIVLQGCISQYINKLYYNDASLNTLPIALQERIPPYLLAQQPGGRSSLLIQPQ